MSNTQGAPTVGLGQDVTFNTDPVTGTPLMSRLDQGQMRALGDVVREQIPGATQGPDYKAFERDLEVLSGLGKTVNAAIKEKEQEAFIGGMMDRAQGTTVEEIAQKQPWYATLFGTGAAELGAKAFDIQDKVNRTVATLEAELPNLASMDYTQARAKMIEAMQGSMVEGDEEHNTLVRHSYLKAMPALISQHTKMHIEYTQKQALKNQSAMRRSGFERIENLRVAVAAGRLEQEDMLAQANSIVADSLPTQGQNLDVWEAATTADLITAAEEGYVTAVEVFMSNGRGELFTPQNKAKIEAAKSRGNTLLAARWMEDPDVVVKLAQLQRNVTDPPDGNIEQHVEALLDFVDEGTRNMGASESVFDVRRLDGLIRGGLAEVQRREWQRAEEIRRAVDKDATGQAKLLQRSEGIRLLESGFVTGAKQYLTESEINDYLLAQFQSTAAQDYGKAVNYLFKSFELDGGYVNRSVARGIQHNADMALQKMAKNGFDQETFNQLYTPFKMFKERGMAVAYFGSELAGKLDRLDERMIAAGNNPGMIAVAFEEALVQKKPAKVSADVISELTKDGWFSNGQVPELSGMSDEEVQKALSYLPIGNYATPERGAREELPSAFKSGRLEVLGGQVVWNGERGSVMSYLKDPVKSGALARRFGTGVFPTDRKVFDQTFESIRESRLAAMLPPGADIVSSTTVRVDDGDNPTLLVMGFDERGEVYPVKIEAADFYEALSKSDLYANTGKRKVEADLREAKAQRRRTAAMVYNRKAKADDLARLDDRIKSLEAALQQPE